MRRLVIVLGLATVLFLISLTAICQVRDDGPRQMVVVGESMSPMLDDGDIVEVRVITSIDRFDVVVYDSNEVDARPVVGRVVGLPDETVEVRNGAVWIDGVRLQEPTTVRSATYEDHRELAAIQYYILGDNRNDSLDSHLWGPTNRSQIKGEVVLP
jgi:signal peptidase I